MEAKVLILRALPWGSDSRATRWASIYAPRDVIWGCWGTRDPKYVGWNVLDWRPKRGYLSFVVGYSAFIFMSFFYTLRKLGRDDILLCIDLETILFGLFAARIRGAKVHFDIADPFYLAKPVPFKRLWHWLEKYYISLSDIVTAPHSTRLHIYYDNIPSHARIVENVPDIVNLPRKRSFLQQQNDGSRMTFGYFGALESHRGLKDLLDFIQAHEHTSVIIGGRGSLEPLIIKLASRCQRIQYLGFFDSKLIAELSNSVDIYYAIYEPTKPLHMLASPNKYYEHLALAIPILCSKNILQANQVIHFHTGWVIDCGVKPLMSWYYEYKDNQSAFEDASFNAKHLWKKKFSNWLAHQQKTFQAV